MARILLVVTAFALVSCTPTSHTEDPSPQADSSIVGEEIDYEVGGVTLKGYIAYDSSQEGSRPGVLVVHEWWGHNEYTRDRARQLAEMGYTALAVDMYGDGRRAEHPEDANAFMMEVFDNMQAGVDRFQAAKAVLNGHATTDPDKTAAIGYCFGGAIVLHMARTGADLDVVAAFHAGALETGNDPNNITGRVFVAHGADDPLVRPEAIESFKANMDAAGVRYEFVAYPGAVHAFTNPDATAKGEQFGLPLAYQQEADEQSWAAMQAVFIEAFGG
ncbi:MAG: dienelactone hydrolase family protein [Planctomycetota bacterium]